MNFKRKKPRRAVRCKLCTPGRMGNSKKVYAGRVTATKYAVPDVAEGLQEQEALERETPDAWSYWTEDEWRAVAHAQIGEPGWD